MRLALAQINPCVGDLKGNTDKIIENIAKAKREKADLVIFPELAITGYPPEDLLLKPQFIADNLACLHNIQSASKDIAVFVGFVASIGKDLYNAGAFIENGRIREIFYKNNLPNNSVFDEKRYFKEGRKASIVNFKKIKIGLGICEDLWVEKGPYLAEAKKGAKLLVYINASPYSRGKVKQREALVCARAKKTKTTIAYVNMVGGQDELIFDGGSMVVDPKGKVLARSKQFREDLQIIDINKASAVPEWMGEKQEIYEALVLGVRDYVQKNGFSKVVIGLSGGIDSALTLAIAVDALGSQNVSAVFMPSKYSSQQSYDDALLIANNLSVNFSNIKITELYERYLLELQPIFKDLAPNLAEENLQARIRGTILMAISNKFNWLVLTTGNKSETSTGYCTLYGDMAGGYNVLKDIPKTLVYELVDYRNTVSQDIPQSIIKRPPTAELKPNQKDQDTLPPYPALDQIMEEYVERNKSIKEIVKLGADENYAKKVISMIDYSEYKRRQAPPGPRITERAFGKDWRMPITNKYKNGGKK